MERVRWDEETSRRYADDVRRVWRYEYAPWAAIVGRALEERGGAPWVVDLGCGPGLLARELAARLPRARFLLADAARAMLGFARHESRAFSPRVGLVAAGAESVPLRTSAADAVVCKHLLLHVDDVDRVFREVHRVLKPGGLLFVVDFHREAFVGRAVLLWLLVRLKMGSFRAGRFWRAYRSAIPCQEVLRRLAAAGLPAERAAARGVHVLIRAEKPAA